ncbi:MAG: hypothetical protein ACP5NU_05095 [Methanomicrobiales archaeon]|nr:hypothetical protein [Burkholderiaceae bacterium]NLH25843.1 hypothetical protein [Methanomicrobiales archaeon]HMZ32300.1 hypothetical protein [Methanoregulaceae archaeon]HNI41937.1 hypothetical protein [Methanoregulaceae archaeon]HNL87085.1 hypothetical protein [Methanoregulaceae archaeon]
MVTQEAYSTIATVLMLHTCFSRESTLTAPTQDLVDQTCVARNRSGG